jgi:RND family efflux transporter MFP subunit
VKRFVLCAALLVALLGCQERRPVPSTPEAAPPEAPAAPSASVTMPAGLEQDGRLGVEPARAGRVADVVTVPGEVDAAPDARHAVATTVAARIVRWHVVPGEAVRAGAPVVTLEAREVAEQRQALERGRIDLGNLEAREAEETRLLPQGATSGRSLRETRAALAHARSTIDGARRVLAVAQAGERGRAGQFTLAAPIGGTVVQREGVAGAGVEAGTVLATVVDLTRLRVVAHVPEDAADVAEGARALVTLRGREGAVPARVVWRDAVLASHTRTRTVQLEPEETTGLLLAQSGTVSLERAGTNAGEEVLLPAAAVHREGARTFVFVRTGEGRYAPRAVTLGRDNGALVEVLTGVRVGEPVLVRGVFLVASEWRRADEGGGA